MNSQAPAPSWIDLAQHRIQDLSTIPYDGGTQTPRRLQLLNTGYLEGLDLVQDVSFQYSVAPTGTDTQGAVDMGLNRLTLVGNSLVPFYDCDGVMTQVITAIQRRYDGGAISFPPLPTTFIAQGSVGTGAHTNVWNATIPLAINLANMPFPIGLYQTALNNLQINVIARFLPVVGTANVAQSGMYTGGTLSTSGGQLSVKQNYFDPIYVPSAQPPLGLVHQWSETQVPVAGAGEVTIQFAPPNYYTRVIFSVIQQNGAIGDVMATTGPGIQWGYGPQLFPVNETHDECQARMYRQYGFDLTPFGIYTIDLIQSTHTQRDWFDSNNMTNLRANLFLGGSSWPGMVNVAIEQFIPISATGVS